MAMRKPIGTGKIRATMDEFNAGTLHSGSKEGPKVTDHSQALAIALNQQRNSEAHPARRRLILGQS